MENKNDKNERYAAYGYKNRDDYLNTLADDMGIDGFAVHMIADMLGENEDFDGLVSELEDFGFFGMFNEPEDTGKGEGCKSNSP
jgi:hypothetical protein